MKKRKTKPDTSPTSTIPANIYDSNKNWVKEGWLTGHDMWEEKGERIMPVKDVNNFINGLLWFFAKKRAEIRKKTMLQYGKKFYKKNDTEIVNKLIHTYINCKGEKKQFFNTFKIFIKKMIK